MNKRALIVKLLLIALLMIVVMGATVYFSFKQTGLSLHTGDVKFSVDYEPKEDLDNGEDVQIVEVDEQGEIIGEPDNNATASNISEKNNTLIYEDISEQDG